MAGYPAVRDNIERMAEPRDPNPPADGGKSSAPTSVLRGAELPSLRSPAATPMTPSQETADMQGSASKPEPSAPTDMLASDSGSSAPSAVTRETGRPKASPSPQTPATTSTDSGVFEPGAMLHHYEIIRPLGAGGMGDVVLARDTKLGRRVAIKIIKRLSEKGNKRFLREARATAQCSHENIVVIHEVNEVDGHPYMVLEYLEGAPLSQLVEGGAVAPHRVVELMIPVARALSRAHEFGIVHRDLKPENVLLAASGTVKVLDFGIAKPFYDVEGGGIRTRDLHDGPSLASPLTRDDVIIGTLPYMSPEQLAADGVDHRSDLWAAGIMMFEMLAGAHPLVPFAPARMLEVRDLNTPLTSVAERVQGLTPELVQVVDRCLAKRKQDRFKDANELLGALEALQPNRRGPLNDDEHPYPGLVAFQESEADRFFGRSREVAKMVKWIRERPLTAIAGQSGAGKSSFVRAGVVPALKASGDAWEVLTLRPGRQPLAALASLLQPLTRTGSAGSAIEQHDALVKRLRQQPGYLGALLRRRCRERGTSALLYVDQFEELYTLVPELEQRLAFTACLSGVADDSSTPLRVVVSTRSDFLDRIAEDRQFVEDLTSGLFFLPAPDRDGLREAIVEPAQMAGVQFESTGFVDEMIDVLEATPGALPLLQFAAAKLWQNRDVERKLITEQSYRDLGGVEGALAAHADQIVGSLTPNTRKLARDIFVRLVTPDRTRAVVGEKELHGLTDDSAEVTRLLQQFTDARLLLIQGGDDTNGAEVELVHESLIASWPTLRRWLDESAEDTAFLAELRTVAKQWEQRGRVNGLLWTGDAADESERWRARSQAVLTGREQEYLDAVLQLRGRSAKRRRIAVIATITVLVTIIAGAIGALVVISRAQQRAQKESETARTAEAQVAAQLEELKAKERARLSAENHAKTAAEQAKSAETKAKTAARVAETATTKASEASAKVVQTEGELRVTNKRLRRALAEARAATTKAKKESERAKKMADMATRERQRAESLAEKRRKQLLEEKRKLRKYTTGADL